MAEHRRGSDLARRSSSDFLDSFHPGIMFPWGNFKLELDLLGEAASKILLLHSEMKKQRLNFITFAQPRAS